MSKQLIAVVLAGLVISVGCKKEKEDGTPPETSETSISLEQDLMPVFSRSCGACHQREGGNEKAIVNGVFYETKADILEKVGQYIIPGKPKDSGLFKVCSQSVPVGESLIVMPPPKSNVPKWSTEELDRFSQWITAGALDN